MHKRIAKVFMIYGNIPGKKFNLCLVYTLTFLMWIEYVATSISNWNKGVMKERSEQTKGNIDVCSTAFMPKRQNNEKGYISYELSFA